MNTSEALRGFLISRRARLRPRDVGSPDHGVRRASGLRRKEVAVLAAVGVGHCIRLERGRASRVPDAVAGALRLSPGERGCLRSPARPGPGPDGAGPRGVRPSVRHLLDAMTDTPVRLVARGGVVRAWNRLAAAVFTDFSRIPTGHMGPLGGLGPLVRHRLAGLRLPVDVQPPGVRVGEDEPSGRTVRRPRIAVRRRPAGRLPYRPGRLSAWTWPAGRRRP